jgi:hypothetical protein
MGKAEEVTVPSLDDWEKEWNEKQKAELPMRGNIVPMVKLAAGGEEGCGKSSAR